MVRRGLLVGLVVLAVGTGCGGDGDGDGDGDVQAGDDPGTAELHGTFTVLEDTEHGPQLCHSVLQSLPPQCGGPDVVGWSWDDVDDEESADGTTWGAYEVVGTWDGKGLTLTEPPAPPQAADPPDVGFVTPCPEPAGGWQVVDPATTSDDTLRAAQARAERRDDFAGLWVDQSLNPAAAALDTASTASTEAAMNDPTKLILNVRVAGDVAAAEAEVR